MNKPTPPQPLQLAKSLGVPLIEVAGRLGVTTNWLRQLATKPHHARRIRIAELEAALDQQRLERSLESLMRNGQ